MLITHVSRGAAASFPASTLQVGSNADNGSGGGCAYRASKAALNISALPALSQYTKPGSVHPSGLWRCLCRRRESHCISAAAGCQL